LKEVRRGHNCNSNGVVVPIIGGLEDKAKQKEKKLESERVS